MSGGGGGQSAVVTGPSIQGAQDAANAQISAAQMASQTAQQDTTSAIGALMNMYGTSLGITQPIRAEGNQAAAQLNYMLGLGAAAPGSAPVAPTAPTLSSLGSAVTDQDIKNYIQQNSVSNGYAANGGGVGALVYQGVGASPDSYSGAVAGSQYANGDYSAIENASGMSDAIRNQLAQNQLPNAQATYANNQTAYQQQLDAYNQANSIYQQYQAKGTATPQDINNIVSNLPGYQFQMSQGVNALQNSASASGMLNSGNLLEGLSQYGQGVASNYYQNYLNNLSGLAGMGTNAATGAASQANSVGNSIAGAYDQNATNVGNAQLAAGQAQASAYTTPAAFQQMNTQSLGGGGMGLGGIASLGLGIAGLGTGGGGTVGGGLLGML